MTFSGYPKPIETPKLNDMKHLTLTLACIFFGMTLWSQNVATDSVGRATIADEIIASGKATISQPAKLNDLLRRATVDDTEEQKPAATRTQTGGYRIQLYSGNNGRQSKAEAERRAAAISSAFPEHQTYVTFDSPYWRLKVGNFRSFEEGQAAMSEMKVRFPGYARDMRLVRSRIK